MVDSVQSQIVDCEKQLEAILYLRTRSEIC